MRMLTNIAFRTQVGLSIAILLVFGLGYFDGEFGFFCFLFWMFSIFFQAGLTMGNLTALAMEPVGHIAGTAASLISAIATIGSVFLAAIVGQFFDGTPIAMIVAILLVFGLGYFDGEFGFFCFLFWMFSIFFQAGLTMGNLTALAMEPVGHIAGTAASLISAIATIGSVFLAAIVGQFFDGTPIAMIVGITLFASFGAVSSHNVSVDENLLHQRRQTK
jgi:hypothetical protein